MPSATAQVLTEKLLLLQMTVMTQMKAGMTEAVTVVETVAAAVTEMITAISRR